MYKTQGVIAQSISQDHKIYIFCKNVPKFNFSFLSHEFKSLYNNVTFYRIYSSNERGMLLVF